MEFEIEGYNHSILDKNPSVTEIKKQLSMLPDGKLYSNKAIKQKIHRGDRRLREISEHLMDYREKINGRLLWGNKKTIEALRQKLADNE